MQPLNTLDFFLKPFLIPFESSHPFLPLTIICMFTNLIGLYYFKKLTDQRYLNYIQKNIELIHLEVKIRPNNFRELYLLLKKSASWNLLYLKSSVIPSLLIVVPLCLLLFPIEAHFSHYPIRTGNIFSVEIIQKNSDNKTLPIELSEIPAGLELIESETTFSPKVLNSWYFRAKSNGIYHLAFISENWTGTKRVVVADSIQPLNQTRKSVNWINSLYSSEKTAPDHSEPIKSISVSYEKAKLQIPGLNFHFNWICFLNSTWKTSMSKINLFFCFFTCKCNFI